ncbi:MAG: hypothetical protein AABZ60_22815 [Planctomycetota bacterium]
MWVEEVALWKKEFLYFRSPIPFWVVSGSFLFHSLLLLGMWPTNQNSIQAAPKIFNFFLVTNYSFFFVANLFIAGMSAISFTTEKEQGTYELLQSTLIAPWKFFVAKFLALFLYLLTLFSTLIPVYILGMLVGGIQLEQIFKCGAITIITCVLNAFISVLASISLSFSSDALRRAYLASFLSIGGLGIAGHSVILLAQISVSFFEGGPYRTYFPMAHSEWSSWSNPLYSLYLVLFPAYSPPLWGWIESWAICPLLYLGLSLLLLPFIFLRIYQDLFQRSWSSPLKPLKRLKFLPEERKPWIIQYLIRHTSNAIFQKELCSQFYFRTRSLGWAILVMFGLMFGLNYVCIINSFDFALLAVVELISFGFVTIGIASTVVTKEIENEDFDLIRSTLITPSQFVWGKFQSLSYGLSFPIFICCICNYLYILGRFNHPYSFTEKFIFISIYNFELLFVFYITLILSMMTGIYVKKTIGASILAYLLNFFFYGGAIFILFASGLSRNIRLLAFSPFSAIVMFWSDELSLKNIYVHFFYLIAVFGTSFLMATKIMKIRRWIDP